MMGYAADMCLISTTAGYQNVSKDFNCFVVGDATLATFPANDSPAHATVRAILSCLFALPDHREHIYSVFAILLLNLPTLFHRTRRYRSQACNN